MTKRWLWLLGLLAAAAVPARAQLTQVSATVQDANGQLYVNCSWSAVFVGQNTVPGAGPYQPAALLVGQQGTCDSAGRMTVSLADNINTVRPTPSQWNFSICSAPGYVPGGTYCRSNMLVTITGATQDLTSFFRPLLPLLPGGGGGGGLTVNGTTVTGIGNLNDSIPPPPTFGLNVRWRLAQGNQISGALVGDGNASHCFLGNGQFAPCPGGGGGTFVTVNGTQAVPNAIDFNSNLLVPAGNTPVQWLLNGNQTTGYVPTGGTSGGSPVFVNDTPVTNPNFVNSSSLTWNVSGSTITGTAAGGGTGTIAPGSQVPLCLDASTGQSTLTMSGLNITAGNTILVTVHPYSTASSGFSVSDSAFNTYSAEAGPASTIPSRIYATLNIPGTVTTVTVSRTSGTDKFLFCVAPYTGVGSITNPVTNSGSSSTPSIALTAGGANHYLFGAVTSAYTSPIAYGVQSATPSAVVVAQDSTTATNTASGAVCTVQAPSATSITCGLFQGPIASQISSNWGAAAVELVPGSSPGGGVTLPITPQYDLFASTGAGAALASGVKGSGGFLEAQTLAVTGGPGSPPFTNPPNGSIEWFPTGAYGISSPNGTTFIFAHGSGAGSTNNGGVVLAGGNTTGGNTNEPYLDCEHLGCNFMVGPTTFSGTGGFAMMSAGGTLTATAGQGGIGIGPGGVPQFSVNGGTWQNIGTGGTGSGTTVSINGTSAGSALNIANTAASPPANGRPITWTALASGATSGYLVGDGSTNCLNGQGTYVTCGGGGGTGTITLQSSVCQIADPAATSLQMTGLSITAGETVLVGIHGYFSFTGTQSVTDATSNAYTLEAGPVSGNNGGVTYIYASPVGAAAASTVLNISIGGTARKFVACMAAYSGVASITNPVTNASTVAGTALTISLTAGGAGHVMLGAFTLGGSSTGPLTPTPPIIAQANTSATAGASGALCELTASAAGALTCNLTFTGTSTSWAAAAVELVPTAGGGAGGNITGATANGGLVQTGTTLGMLNSCSNGQYLSWNGTASAWACASPAGGTMTWPLTAGIANYSGSSTWGTSFGPSNPIPANYMAPPTTLSPNGTANQVWTMTSASTQGWAAPSASGGVTQINGTAGAFTFNGPGVNCATTTCTFAGGGNGGGGVITRQSAACEAESAALNHTISGLSISAGDTVLVTFIAYFTDPTFTVTDSAANAYTQVGGATFTAQSTTTTIWYSLNVATAATSVTANITSATQRKFVMCVANYRGVGSIGAHATNSSGTVVPQQTVSLAVGAGSYMVMTAGIGSSGTTSWTGAAAGSLLAQNATSTPAAASGALCENTTPTATTLSCTLVSAATMLYVAEAVELVPGAGGAGSMTWPAVAGIPIYSGNSTWGTSLGTGTANVVPVVSGGAWTTSNAPALSAANMTGAPALSAANMTAFPTLNQSTTGNAATATHALVADALSATPTPCPGGQFAAGILASGNSTGCAAPNGASWPTGAAGIPGYSGANSWDAIYNSTNPIPTSFGGTGSSLSGLTAGQVMIVTGAGTLGPAAGTTISGGTLNQLTSTIYTANTANGRYQVSGPNAGCSSVVPFGMGTAATQSGMGFLNPGVVFCASALELGRWTAGIFTAGTVANPAIFRLIPILTNNIPTCNSANEGSQASIMDASAATNGTVLAGGGSNHVLVYCTGTAWRILGGGA